MNISGMGIFPGVKVGFPAGNLGLDKIVSRLNAQVQQKNQRFDVVAVHSKLDQLKKSEEQEAAQEAPAAASVPVASYNGSRTPAEWAEMSLTNQRNGLQSLSDCLEFQKEKLNNAMQQLEKYERIAAGEFSEDDLKWIAYKNENVSSDVDWAALRKEEAAGMAQRYRDSIQTDFTEVIHNRLAIYDTFSKAYDEYSGGLASQVAGGLLDGITPEGLGLTNLSGEPDEIMEALNSAQKILSGALQSLESAFLDATGKEMRPFDSQPNREMWKQLIDLENMVTQCHSGGMVVGTHTLSMEEAPL